MLLFPTVFAPPPTDSKEVDDEWIQIVEWASDPAINPFGQVNQVRLVAEGDEFSLFINDEYVASFTDDSFPSGGIGPVVTAYDEPPARATFQLTSAPRLCEPYVLVGSLRPSRTPR